MSKKKWRKVTKGLICTVFNEGGETLSFSMESGVNIIEDDGYAFKDLNRDGQLDKYEDWRLPMEERAKDLASKLSLEEIAGLMLYSSHQMIPANHPFFGSSLYNGKPFAESGALASDLSDSQKNFLEHDHLRHILVTGLQDTLTGTTWNNNVQAFVEGIGHGIPANNSSDPRHGLDSTLEFNLGQGVSKWPDELGLAATFEPSLVKEFGKIAAQEYRALGITTALSPQVDLATDPRWGRFSGTFGEDVKLSTDMSKAYCDGFQTTGEHGWGNKSVNAMVKHWPGGGTGEGGRDAHFSFGKFAVYPGDNFNEHLIPFTDGAFNLDDGTKEASAVMPYYTISYDMDKKNGENVGNAFNKYIITDLLREKYAYDGVVCTDWRITHNHGPEIHNFTGKPWGIEEMSVAERHLKAILAGVDQFGGNNELQPVIDAYYLGVNRFGNEAMRKRFEDSARRLLMNIFRVGLFENPYIDPSNSNKIVNKKEFIAKGIEAQIKSLVLVKNKNNTLPLSKGAKVFIPSRYSAPMKGFVGFTLPEDNKIPVDTSVYQEHFHLTSAEDADYALVVVRGPMNVMMGGGYDDNDANNGGNGYVPISLQYRPYEAVHARSLSIAGGDPLEDFVDRSYQGKTVTTYNESDLDLILETKKLMGDKPVIVLLQLKNPAVVNEFEKYVDSILIDFGTESYAQCQILCGNEDPSGLLPLQMPKDMHTVETQCEDVAHDMSCHEDLEGNVYDFGFGLNYNGVINDARFRKYTKARG